LIGGVFGIFSADRVDAANPIFDGSPVHIWNNTIIHPSMHGVDFRNLQALNNTIRNNIIVHPLEDGLTKQYVRLVSTMVDMTQSHNYFTSNIKAPKFKKAKEQDYRLKPGSTLINAGYDLSSEGVTFDYVYNERPAGAVDIGAYEYVTPNPRD
jgi:hypothetical protein